MNLLKNKVLFRQFVTFACIGVINTGIDFGIYFILTRYTGWFDPATAYKYVANILAFMCAATFSYYANRVWTFSQTTSANVNEISKFYATTIMGMILNSVLLGLFIYLFHVNDLIAKGIATIFVILWNFILQKMWVFSSAKNK